MQLVSYAEAVSKRTVTSDPSSAGLIPYTMEDLKDGKAEGLVCGGGPSSTIWCTPPGKHAVIVGRTGAGKTRSCLEPTVIANGTRRNSGLHPKSMLIVDSKRTMYRETSEYMKSQGYDVRLIDLMAAESKDRWSPLTEAYYIIQTTGDISLAEASIARIKASAIASVHSEKDAYWESTAWELVSGVSIALCQIRTEEPTLADVNDTINSKDALRHIEAVLKDRTPKAITNCISLFSANSTWSCVKSVATSMLGFYVTSMGRQVASASTIDFKEIFFNNKKPVCIYVISPDNNKLCSNYTVNLIESATSSYTDEFEKRNLEGTDLYGLILIIDEFARLPRIEQVLSITSTGRSRNITCYLALQSFSQFLERGLYTSAEANVVLEQAAINIYMSNISYEIARDAKFKSGGAITESNMLHLAPGDAYVSVAGKPMIGMHMEPLKAYTPHLDFCATEELVGVPVGRDDIIERILDARIEDECAGYQWELDNDELLDGLLEVFCEQQDG
ncbi:MAG: type IV secretory system conjugative DNA transfer family protein [Atopobiaceae bacterium]|nr:type IV secretory system conjugative DNA transfer family protein [Atopobiaceae bacterium]